MLLCLHRYTIFKNKNAMELFDLINSFSELVVGIVSYIAGLLTKKFIGKKSK